jgi:hypothetical protein
MKKKGSSCVQMKDHKGKPSGLMMEGSVAYQESAEQEVINLETKNPVADKASAMEMSPYKMGHKSPAKQVDERSGDGVTVTGDASKVGGKTTMTEAEKKREALKKRIEERKIREANEKMKRKMQTETAKAEIGKRRIAREQEKRKREGKDYQDAEGKVVRRG